MLNQHQKTVYSLVPVLMLLSACGSAPENGIDGSNGLDGTNGTNGSSGVKGSDGLKVSKLLTCQGTNITYRVGTQIDLFYQETTFSDGTKQVECELHYVQQFGSHSQYLVSSDSVYATGQCNALLDVNDTVGTGYWKFTNDKNLIYNDSNSTVAGLNYNITSFCH